MYLFPVYSGRCGASLSQECSELDYIAVNFVMTAYVVTERYMHETVVSDCAY